MTNKSIANTKCSMNTKTFQTITLIALAVFWAGQFRSIYAGNASITSGYSISIMLLSICNMDVLFTKEKTANKGLNILAKCEGIIFCVWVIATIIQLILK